MRSPKCVRPTRYGAGRTEGGGSEIYPSRNSVGPGGCRNEEVVWKSRPAQVEPIAIGLPVQQIVGEGAQGEAVVRPAQRQVDLSVAILLQFGIVLCRACGIELI